MLSSASGQGCCEGRTNINGADLLVQGVEAGAGPGTAAGLININTNGSSPSRYSSPGPRWANTVIRVSLISPLPGDI